VFAQKVRTFARFFPKDFVAYDDLKQLIRSSGSVGANYIEANNALSKKDFKMRIKICKKEAKESQYWLTLLEAVNEQIEKDRGMLENEAKELTCIFAAILRNSE
jgi:four helix bundle protein